MQVRYQAALRPDDGEIIADGLPNLHGKGGDPAQQVCDSGKAVSPAHNRPAGHMQSNYATLASAASACSSTPINKSKSTGFTK